MFCDTSYWACNNKVEPRHDKTNNMSVRPAKTQISLGIRLVWSESSLCAQWVAKDPRFLHVDNEDSDQTGRMPRLIWVFAGRTATLFVLSCRGSNTNWHHTEYKTTRGFKPPSILILTVPMRYFCCGSLLLLEPRHEKIYLCHMRVTKTQISLRAFVVHCLDSMIHILAKSKISRL